MAINIKAGNNIVKAKANSDLSVFTPDDTLILRGLSLSGNYISYDPSRELNSLTAIESGKGYLIASKIDRDLETIFGDVIFTGDGIVTLA